MKALDILKKESSKLRYTLNLFDDVESAENNLKISKGYFELKELTEAITELEALQAPKTCETCVYHIIDDDNTENQWVDCKMLYAETRDLSDMGLFSCSNYTPKAQQ